MLPSNVATQKYGFLLTLAPIVYWALLFYSWLIIIRVLISWFTPNQKTPFMGFLRKLVDPALKATHGVWPLYLGGLDFSPVLLIVFINFLANFLRLSLINLGSGYSFSQLGPIFVICLLGIILSLSWFIWLMVIVRTIMSLVDPSPYNPLVMLVYGLTEPILAPLRSLLPSRCPAGLDVRALVAVVAIFLINHYILLKLQKLAYDWFIAGAPAIIPIS
ncbi:MAG: YggT family protein [Deltaproteobacteria bacterium]|nr:YggT family protein [Deltaproteobacteria bacterium]